MLKGVSAIAVRGDHRQSVSDSGVLRRISRHTREEKHDVGERRPPLWSSGQSFWLQIQRSRVRFPALPDFLSSSGSGTGSTQPRDVN